MNFRKAVVLVIAVSSLIWSQGQSPPKRARASTTLKNPLLSVGPDPWVEFKDGVYYYMNTTITNLTLWKTRSMAELKSAPKRVVWTAPATGPYSHDIWAPEIHFLEGKWYIYFAGDARIRRIVSGSWKTLIPIRSRAAGR